jgi:uncharacterized protein YuzE
MRLEYDKEIDATYIYLKFPIVESEAKKTVKVNENITIDFDKDGKLIGVEILDASKLLSKEELLNAQLA